MLKAENARRKEVEIGFGYHMNKEGVTAERGFPKKAYLIIGQALYNRGELGRGNS